MARPSPCVLGGSAQKHNRCTEGSSGASARTSTGAAATTRGSARRAPGRAPRPGRTGRRRCRPGPRSHPTSPVRSGPSRRTAGTSDRRWSAPAGPRGLPRGAHASTSGPPLWALWQPARSPGFEHLESALREDGGTLPLVSRPRRSSSPTASSSRGGTGVEGSAQELRACTVPRGAGLTCRAPGRPRPAAGPNGGGRCRCAVVKTRARVFRPCPPSSATLRPERGRRPCGRSTSGSSSSR